MYLYSLVFSPRCCFICRSQFVGDEVGHRALELVEDGEGERDIEDDTHETWADTLIEAHDAGLGIDFGEAVLEALVLVRVLTLHLGLNDVNGVVGHRGAETRETTGQKVNDDLDRNVGAEELLGVLEDNEAHTLVGGLLHKRGNDTLVATSGALSLDDGVDTMEQVAVLGLSRQLVVDEPRFQRLLRGDNHDSLHCTSADTTQEVVPSGLLSQNVLLNVGVGTETDVVLGHGEHKER